MGGQACVFYGAAEFSRDLDLLVLVEPDNLDRLRKALLDMEAAPISVPSFEAAWLNPGHAVPFRCNRQDVSGLRIDLMSSLRGVAAFEDLWGRRTNIEVAGKVIDLLALEDLVKARNTQRDKDWPMIRRLIEQSYFSSEGGESVARIDLWLRELTTAELLVAVAQAYPAAAQTIASVRPAVQSALAGDLADVASALEREEDEEQRCDRAYWEPLKRELEELRHRKRKAR
jgi:hypothetical protein